MAISKERQNSLKTVKDRGRKFDAFPDRIDLRDWIYQPALSPLPNKLINCHLVPEILDQGREGACTGFALAAVVNFLLHKQNKKHGVSPRMLYELARRYDEWPGENYEGSSARGAMKGWIRHGVCRRETWKDTMRGAGHLTDKALKEAFQVPGGSYYRIKHLQIRDMHAAINETGILYATMMVHKGWDDPGPAKVDTEYFKDGKKAKLKLPVITRAGSADGGHAVAITGYTEQGFVIQNSWGKGWGAAGFALLPYEDYLLHATDVWVAQLGVPVSLDLWETGATDTKSGMFRASQSIPLADIRPYVIDVANNGELSDSGNYWTTEQDLERLFKEIIPGKTKNWQKKRVLLYLHGGLNSEVDTAKRIVAMRDVMLANEIYPLHIMWESDFISSLGSSIKDLFTDADKMAGAGFLNNLTEAKDKIVELTLAKIGGAVWTEMKENAALASRHKDGKGAMQLISKYVESAKPTSSVDLNNWELHVVGHSAGSIFAAYSLPILCTLGVSLKSIQFMAPAIRTDLFKKLLLDDFKSNRYPIPTMYILNDKAERDDTVGPYGKSLLYLVSNAFEGKREVPLLGMETFLRSDKELAALLSNNLIISGTHGQNGSRSSSTTHGGFDNDADSMNSVLYRILGKEPARPFTKRDLDY